MNSFDKNPLIEIHCVSSKKIEIEIKKKGSRNKLIAKNDNFLSLINL
jgi:hypothetical protein